LGIKGREGRVTAPELMRENTHKRKRKRNRPTKRWWDPRLLPRLARGMRLNFHKVKETPLAGRTWH